jgi:hypothetical protein
VTFPKSDNEKSDVVKYSTLEEIIKSDAKKNLTLKDVHSLLQQIKESVEHFELESELNNLYQIKLSISKSTPYYANCISIGQFVARNKSVYFAEPTYKTETYEDIEKPDKMDVLRGIQTKPYTITKKREVIDGYELKENYPYEHISIEVNANYPNINSYNCTIAFVTSDRKIKLYYFISNYIKENWNKRTLNSRYEWDANEFNLIDSVQIIEYIKSINVAINQRITSDIKRQFESFNNE